MWNMDYVTFNNGVKMPMQGLVSFKCGIPREEIFVTSKAWISEMGYEETLKAFEDTLARLGLEFLDLYLIHMPFGDCYGS